jgi:hypothetical protein
MGGENAPDFRMADLFSGDPSGAPFMTTNGRTAYADLLQYAETRSNELAPLRLTSS